VRVTEGCLDGGGVEGGDGARGVGKDGGGDK